MRLLSDARKRTHAATDAAPSPHLWGATNVEGDDLNACLNEFM